MAELQLEFVDLTLNPPQRPPGTWILPAIRRALSDHGMAVVGHTAYYLPLGSSFESIRKASVDEFRRCLDAFAEVGARWMNLHPDRHTPMHNRAFYIRRNIESLEKCRSTRMPVGVG